MAKTFLEALNERMLLFDGAMGTILQQLKLLENIQCPEALNQSRPDAITTIHRHYLEAGADVVETNTFGCNSIKLGKVGLESKAAKLCASGVSCARRAVEAANKTAFVAVSVSSTGELLAPMGSATPEQFLAAYKEQLSAAAKEGADLVLIETMSDLAEARCALLMAKEVCKVPVGVSFTFENNGYTLMGNPPDAVANVASALGADFLGINCSGGAKQLLPTFETLRRSTRLPILAMPNAGIPYVINGKTTFPDTPNMFALSMKPFIDGGANAVGGCCGTGPAHIRALKEMLGDKAQAESHRDETHPSSARIVTTLEHMRNAPVVKFSGDGALDMLLDMEDDAFILDPQLMSRQKINELLDTLLPLLGGKPLGFMLHTPMQARSLLHYPGVAAVTGDEEAVYTAMSTYGALKL